MGLAFQSVLQVWPQGRPIVRVAKSVTSPADNFSVILNMEDEQTFQSTEDYRRQMTAKDESARPNQNDLDSQKSDRLSLKDFLIKHLNEPNTDSRDLNLLCWISLSVSSDEPRFDIPSNFVASEQSTRIIYDSRLEKDELLIKQLTATRAFTYTEVMGMSNLIGLFI